MPLALVLLAVGIVCVSFLLFIERPQDLRGDTAFQAFSALQFVRGDVSTLHAVRLVDPFDLAKDVECKLVAWSPAWTLLFVLAYKTGLSPGPAAKAIELLLSVSGAIGWVWIVSILGLKSYWRAAGVILASLYCLRADLLVDSDFGDPVIYAVAPWLIGAALSLSRGPCGWDRARIWKVLGLCLALGSVYWLKYSGIFLGAAVSGALVLNVFRVSFRQRPWLALGVAALCGASFGLPILLEKAYNYSRSGSDLVEATVARGVRPRTPELTRGLIEDTVFDSGGILFGAASGAGRITQGVPLVIKGSRLDYRPAHWLVRLPGLLLLVFFLYLILGYPNPFVRDMAMLLVALPVVGSLALSIATGTRFVAALGRICEPSWIFIELLILVMLSARTAGRDSMSRTAWASLAALTAIQVLLFSFLPFEAVKDAWKDARGPRYQSGAASTWVPDFSGTDSRSVSASVAALVRKPADVVVSATRNHNVGTGTWVELEGHRLLPLTNFTSPLAQTHGRDGANFNGRSKFLTSRPLHVVLVGSNPYGDADFDDSLALIRSRFAQAVTWTRQPAPPGSRVELWTTDLVPELAGKASTQ
ncbi:MAG TPA: hypothetical protein VG273_08830 [Bryobacteraceae bacterium]|jgi:hypothetical protein|nr:hypothetical protein [Bryobacteraceae bacterium]